MEFKDYLAVGALAVSLSSLVITLILMLRKGGAREATVEHKLGAVATREELQREYVTKQAMAKAFEDMAENAALQYLGSREGHDLVERTAKEIYNRITSLADILHNAVNVSSSQARDKTEQLNIQVHVLKEGIGSVSDSLATLEKIVSELMTKGADQGARLTTLEQSRVVVEQLRVQVARIEAVLTRGGKNL